MYRIKTIFCLFFALGLTAVLAGCGGGSGSSSDSNSATPSSCAIAAQQSWLSKRMADQYYWFDHMGAADAGAANMTAYFSSLLYTDVDRFSFAESSAEYNQFFNEGVFVGFGYTLAWSDAASTVLKVRHVEPNSPVGLAGLRRGDTIISIDGYSPSSIVAGTPGRVSSAGITRTFVFQNATGTHTITVNSAYYRFVSVPGRAILSAHIGMANVKVGYMVYQQFVNSGAPELASAFEAFAAAGITELIVDLRYNGGGSISVARDLGSMVGGSQLEGKIFTRLLANTRHPENNTAYQFVADSAALPAAPLESLTRIIFITSAQTASASELLINALSPFMPVILIGATTYGKPYGFWPFSACDLTYNAVNFEVVNALDQGGYSHGMTPTCNVADDLDHALGDPAEARLAASLHYLETGACPVQAGRAALLGTAQTPGLPPPVQNSFGELQRLQMVAD